MNWMGKTPKSYLSSTWFGVTANNGNVLSFEELDEPVVTTVATVGLQQYSHIQKATAMLTQVTKGLR